MAGHLRKHSRSEMVDSDQMIMDTMLSLYALASTAKFATQ